MLLLHACKIFHFDRDSKFHTCLCQLKCQTLSELFRFWTFWTAKNLNIQISGAMTFVIFILNMDWNHWFCNILHAKSQFLYSSSCLKKMLKIDTILCSDLKPRCPTCGDCIQILMFTKLTGICPTLWLECKPSRTNVFRFSWLPMLADMKFTWLLIPFQMGIQCARISMHQEACGSPG